MGIFDELDKQKSSTKKSSGGIFAELDKQKEKAAKVAAVPAEKELLRSQGKAVSVRSDRSNPTFGGEILRGIAKPAVTLMARPAQLTAALMGWDENRQTLKSGYLGDIKTSKSGKDVVKDVGRGLELVSNAVGVGAVRNVGRNAVKQGAIQVAKRVGIEGAAAGFIQGVGSGISEGKTGKDLLWNAAKSTGFGGLGGFLLGGAGAKLIGTKTPEKLAKQAEEAANIRQFGSKARPSVPKAGAPIVPSQVDVRLAENVPTNVGTKGSIPTVSTEIPTLPQDKTITPKGTIVPKVTVGEPIKVPKAKIEKQTEVLNSIPDEDFTPQVKETSKSFYNEDPERAFRMIEGKESIPEGVNKRALYALAKIDATGESAVRLAELRGISSKSGQDLGMLNQGKNNGIVDKIVETNDYLKKTMNPKEAKKAMAELADEIRANKPTRQELESLINEITC